MTRSEFRKSFKNLVILTVLLFGFLVVPFSTFVGSVKADPIFGEYPKWTRYGMGSTVSQALIADVRSDITGEEVIVTGVGWVRALRGTDGSPIWEELLEEVWYWTQPQMADLDNDGDLEIIVPYGDWPSGGNGLYVLNADDGSRFWPDSRTRGELGGTSIVSSPVIGDIDGDGYPTVFVATEDVTNGLQGTGRITALDHEGNVLHQAFIWRPCAGGLSLADGDRDDTYELYMGDRHMYMGDGGFGKGVRSFWADNLTSRWNHPDVLCSSQAPPLADVNGDGILDVIVSNQRGGVLVLDSRTGSAIRKDVRRRDLPTHYQGSVYDIDEDGNVEILFADGDHGSTPNDCAVFDLFNWEVDGRFDVGLCHYGPTVANVYGDSSLEIIATSEDGVHVVDPETYTVIDEVTGLGGEGEKLQNAVVQDIDADGLVEIVVTSESGTVWAYNAPAAAPAQRPRTEVQFYNERRTNAAVFMAAPGGEPEPIISGVSPSDKEEDVPLSLSELRFTLSDNQGDDMDYTVTASPNIASDSDTNVASGTEIVVSITGSLNYYTLYSWTVEVDDGTYTTSKTFRFRTIFEPVSNTPPQHAVPFLDDEDGTSYAQLTCFNQSTTDSDGDEVTNIYNWYKNDVSLTRLLLPFDKRSATITEDYSGYGNDAYVHGATWTSDGVLGGCYEFGGDDYLMIPHSNSLGGDGTWSEITIEHWIYFSENQDGSRIISKVPSYEIGFQSGRNNRLYAGVRTDEDDETTSYYYLSRNTWHHVAMTYKDGEGITLYVNGVARAFEQLSGTITTSAGTRPETREPLYVGWFDFFKGKIDEVRIYPRALSAEQVYQRYAETKDGVSNNASLVWQETLSGELWKCEVTPNDMYSDGSAEFSNTIGPLLNSPPDASNLRFPKRSRSEFALTSEDLEGAYDYFDPDGDAEGATEIRWFKNHIPQSAYDDLLTVPSSATAAGEKWYFTVTPSDGSLFGSIKTSPQVSIIDNAPPTHSDPLLESSEGTDRDDEEIACYNQSTSDTDPVTNIYNWYVDDTSYTNLLLPFDTDSATTVKDYSGYDNDGTISGATWTTDGISGGAYNFDGDDIITVGLDETLGGDGTWSEISLEFWVKTASPLHGTRLIGRNLNTSTTGSFMVGFQTSFSDPDNTLFWGITVDGDWTDNSEVDNWVDVRDRLSLETGMWYHVFCTYESGPGLTIYINGIRKHNMPLNGTIDYDPDEMLHIGSPGPEAAPNRFLNGSLDEIRLYPEALTPAQIFQRYLETKGGWSSNSTIVPQETVQGEDWKCEVTPNDSWQDGTPRTSNILAIGPATGNDRPRIDVFTPTETTLEVNAGDSLNFTHFSSDPDGNPLTYSWLLDDIEQATSQNWTYLTDSGDAGTRNVTLVVTDGEDSDSQQWNIAVVAIASEEDSYLVVRGLNNMIYYRTYNASTESWADWKAISSGSTCDSPAATALSGRLYIVVRGTDGGSIWFGSVNLTDDSFTGWTRLGGATNSAPTLTHNGTHLTLLVRGLNNAIYYRYYDCESEAWENWNVISGGATCDSPAAAVTGDSLHIVVRGFSSASASGNQSLWYGMLNLTDSSFSGWTRLPGATASAPTLTASESSSEVYLVVRGLTDVLYLNTWNGVSWQGWETVPGGHTSDSPAAAVTGDNMQIVVRSVAGTSLWHSYIDLNTSSHSGWNRIDGASPSSPTLTS